MANSVTHVLSQECYLCPDCAVLNPWRIKHCPLVLKIQFLHPRFLNQKKIMRVYPGLGGGKGFFAATWAYAPPPLAKSPIPAPLSFVPPPPRRPTPAFAQNLKSRT